MTPFANEPGRAFWHSVGAEERSHLSFVFADPREMNESPAKPQFVQVAIAVAIVSGAYLFILLDRLRTFPQAFQGFGFHPEAFLRASTATQVHVAAGFVAVVLGLTQLGLAKGTARHRALGYTWVASMLALCASALLVKEGMGLLQMLAVVVTGLLGRAVWLARRKRIADHAHLMRVLVLGATVGVGLFTALPGRVTWSLFFAG